jgi:hypothetical protein
MNPASTKIKSALIRFELLFIFPPFDLLLESRASPPGWTGETPVAPPVTVPEQAK